MAAYVIHCMYVCTTLSLCRKHAQRISPSASLETGPHQGLEQSSSPQQPTVVTLAVRRGNCTTKTTLFGCAQSVVLTLPYSLRASSRGTGSCRSRRKASCCRVAPLAYGVAHTPRGLACLNQILLLSAGSHDGDAGEDYVTVRIMKILIPIPIPIVRVRRILPCLWQRKKRKNTPRKVV